VHFVTFLEGLGLDIDSTPPVHASHISDKGFVAPGGGALDVTGAVAGSLHADTAPAEGQVTAAAV
jgi:hypothetical protein